MEKRYTLYYHNTVITEGKTKKEFIDKLCDLNIDFKYYSECDCFIIKDKNYWYVCRYEIL